MRVVLRADVQIGFAVVELPALKAERAAQRKAIAEALRRIVEPG
jgi:hypothetical protein